MAISLTPELDQMVHDRLASGRYQSVEDVLTAALRSLREEDDTIAAIAEGYEDFKAGRYEPWEKADTVFREKHGIPKSP